MEEGQVNKDQVKAIRAEQTVTVTGPRHDKQEYKPGERRSHVCSDRPTEEVTAVFQADSWNPSVVSLFWFSCVL